MFAGLHETPEIEQTIRTFDTLVVSTDHTLFFQLSSFLKEFEPNRTVVLADSLSLFTALENELRHCDIILYDMRSRFASVDVATTLLAHPPNNAFAIGIASGHEDCNELLSLPGNLHLAGFININSGWRAVWHQLSAIKAAWYNPQVMSRIEEVPVSEILQMISCNRWSSNVLIDGTIGSTPSTEPLRGCISFFKGEPHTGWSWQSAGNEAIFDLLSIKQGVMQVIKNHGTPLYRNIYRQIDELILSHAVACDESTAGLSFESPVPSCADTQPLQEQSIGIQPENDSDDAETADCNEQTTDAGETTEDAHPIETEHAQLTWWQANGSSLMQFVKTTTKCSFPLRWMNKEGLRDLQRKQPEAMLLLFYGSNETKRKLFMHASRNFSPGKLSDPTLLPVMRLGNRHIPYLYIIGMELGDTDNDFNSFDTFALIGTDEEDFLPTLLDNGNKTLQLFADSENNTIFENIQTSVPFHGMCTLNDWPSCAAALSTVVNTLMQSP